MEELGKGLYDFLVWIFSREIRVVAAVVVGAMVTPMLLKKLLQATAWLFKEINSSLRLIFALSLTVAAVYLLAVKSKSPDLMTTTNAQYQYQQPPGEEEEIARRLESDAREAREALKQDPGK